MPAPVPGSAEAMLLLYTQGNPAGMITMTVEEFLRKTDLGLMSRRSDPMRAIDNALRNYHLQKGSAEALRQLEYAFNRWIEFQQRQNKIWTKSDRNHSNAITDLHAQMNTALAASKSPTRSKEEMEAIQAIIDAEKGAVNQLFLNRQMIFKTKTNKLKEQLRVGAGPGAKIVNAVRKMDQVGKESVKTACANILGGHPPDALFMALGHGTFDQFAGAAATILSSAVTPVKLLADIVKLGMAASSRYQATSARFAFRSGASSSALNSIILMIDDELKTIALDAAKQTGQLVATAFGAGPIASAASAVVDLMVNLKAYRGMMQEMEAANRMLTAQSIGLNVFNVSPVTGCYYLLMADTSMWINFDMNYIGMKGWKDEIMLMRNKAEPVREKARELIRKSKICMSGTEGFNGLEWEPSWRNNKTEFLSSGRALVSAGGAVKKKWDELRGNAPPPGTIPKPPGPLKENIYAMNSQGRAP